MPVNASLGIVANFLFTTAAQALYNSNKEPNTLQDFFVVYIEST